MLVVAVGIRIIGFTTDRAVETMGPTGVKELMREHVHILFCIVIPVPLSRIKVIFFVIGLNLPFENGTEMRSSSSKQYILLRERKARRWYNPSSNFFGCDVGLTLPSGAMRSLNFTESP
jgi:hypothetical protein